MTNNTRRLGAAGVLLSAVFLNVASVQAVVLPTPIQDVTARQYGDFWIYSMALLQVQLNLQDGLQPGDLDKPHSGDYYYIPSSPGQIDNLLVIATGTNNKPTVTNVSFPNTGADDAYPTPSGNSVTSFSTVTTPDPQPADVPPPPNNLRPAFAGDQSVSWDVQLGVLREFCAEDKLVFWFNMNETGTENDLSGQDLLAWAAVTLEDLDGPGGKVTFFLSQDKAASQGGFNPTTGAGGADVAQDVPAPILSIRNGSMCIVISPWTPTRATSLTSGPLFRPDPTRQASTPVRSRRIWVRIRQPSPPTTRRSATLPSPVRSTT